MLRTSCMIVRMEADVLLLEALPTPIDLASVTQVFAFVDTLLTRRFQTFWDLRQCRKPPTWVVFHCLRWALRRRSALNRCNTRLCVLVHGKLVSVVNVVLRGFGPTCPILVTQNEAACQTFLSKGF